MRRKQKYNREIEPDFKYNSPVIAKFVNVIMKHGKKTIAEKIVYTALEQVKELTQKDPMETFDLALKNIAPLIELKSKRVGGANYQVPREVRGDRKQMLTFRWLIAAAQSKKGKPMASKLAEEVMLASKNEGTAIKKKQDTHRMAEANKAFAHFSW
ncbi:30S ribosomal protein S7 [Candidatus Azambacteria bacterium RIFCSPHIGHO2_02_FULL_52_12]|uniref:Small ribosomal subunit protein uS7 n=1 Tax=Candidatus Azambacteria bacterium RIFCSPLOWO2_01_FULL_46_25 TaxID=1797298 RepID=A0A1F5BU72_9BACT|nr:MAG: 30S ribosomal protein S7 [Candidatus Azambacteria bacterium RIFCSPHIGHO2_02_FULL_52_12]OGD34147.1 MAG: 30S ribosomal protein S7 [Candidatus Azambacteria bacterium RIFCSPLOWO2_01_FULL_46_25]OGD36746.1 MAG: 30S ribosomal protein S7 [Candidatus Azambacteria bacterium RIFCSPHIGHO2_01_FULL_51_74]